MTPLKVIREYCLYCMNNQPKEIKLCPSILCLFYFCRFGKNKTNPRISALRLIKKHCKDCSGYSTRDLKNCLITDCSLFVYRQGKNPTRAVVKNYDSDTFLPVSRANFECKGDKMIKVHHDK